MIARDDLLEQFLVEGRELVVQARRELAALVRAPADRPALDGLFRAAHTLKGSSALFDLGPLTRLLHAVETELDRARSSGALAPDAADGVVRALDHTELWLDALDDDDDPAAELGPSAESLALRLQHHRETPEHAPAAADDWARSLAAGVEAAGALVAVRYTPSPEAYFRGDDPLAAVRDIPGLLKLVLAADPPTDPIAYDPFRCGLRISAVTAAPLSDVQAALRLVAAQVEFAVVEPGKPASAGLRLRALRVDADRLDSVAALVDELVIAKNALAHQTALVAAACAGTAQERDLAIRQASVERVVGDLHAAITGLRLAPLSHLFSRFPRQVRELADSLGKDVDLTIRGEQVSLDKSVVEGLFEPILHLLRNAVDHGVEPPAARRAAGKLERATIVVSAEPRGADVVVEIADDGRGIDLARVREAAVARGVLSAEAAAGLADEAAARLVFAPGFSTAGEVSDVSGRGVGMDAVHAAVTRMGGRIAFDNRPGEGLTVRLILPAQVILTKILVVKAGGEDFGVPLESVNETHRVRPDEVTHVRAGRAYVRRDGVIPLLRLAELLGGPPSADERAFTVLSISAGGEQVGVQIDAIGERIEAPMRPMSGMLSAYPGLLGTVLQGDGRILLVLDLAELAA